VFNRFFLVIRQAEDKNRFQMKLWRFRHGVAQHALGLSSLSSRVGFLLSLSRADSMRWMA
jgi:hypothetical protein